MKFEIILTEKGKRIFKGGNIEVMSKPLGVFEAENMKEAEKHYEALSLNYSGMNFGHYKLIEIKGDKNE